MIINLNNVEKERKSRIDKLLNTRLTYSNACRNQARKNRIKYMFNNQSQRIVLDKLKKELNQCQEEYLFSCKQIGTAHRLAQMIEKLEKYMESLNVVNCIELLIQKNLQNEYQSRNNSKQLIDFETFNYLETKLQDNSLSPSLNKNKYELLNLCRKKREQIKSNSNCKSNSLDEVKHVNDYFVEKNDIIQISQKLISIKNKKKKAPLKGEEKKYKEKKLNFQNKTYNNQLETNTQLTNRKAVQLKLTETNNKLKEVNNESKLCCQTNKDEEIISSILVDLNLNEKEKEIEFDSLNLNSPNSSFEFSSVLNSILISSKTSNPTNSLEDFSILNSQSTQKITSPKCTCKKSNFQQPKQKLINNNNLNFKFDSFWKDVCLNEKFPNFHLADIYVIKKNIKKCKSNLKI